MQWDSSAARSYGRGTRSDNSREQSNPTTELTFLQRQSPLVVIANNVLDHSETGTHRSRGEAPAHVSALIEPATKKMEHTTPSPILHQTRYFGMTAPPSSSPLFQTSHVPAYNSNRQSRVRFASSGESVTSESEASKVHMMAGSYASSSAFSSSLVMSEEDRRLAAMGMGRADPKSSC